MSIHHERYKAQRVRERSFVLLLLFAAMVFMIFAGTVLAFYLFPDAYELLSRRTDRSASTSSMEVRIADRTFTIPEPLVARVERNFLGPATRVDLKVQLPFEPNTDFAAPRSGQISGDWFLLTLEARQGRKSLEQFYNDIYTVYLKDEAESKDGMTLRRFKPGGPYSDSVIYIDERSGKRAVIRCDVQPSALGAVLCERLIFISDDVMARLRFKETDLQTWPAIENTAHTIVQKITIPSGG